MTDLVLLCCHDGDREWLELLRQHLAPFRSRHAFDMWERGDVPAGGQWRDAVRDAWARGRAVVLLASPGFLADDFVPGTELHTEVLAARSRGLPILWLPISYCAYQSTELNDLEPLHDPTRPLDSLDESAVHRTLVDVCEKIAAAAHGVSTPSHAPAPRSDLRARWGIGETRGRLVVASAALVVLVPVIAWSTCGPDDSPAETGAELVAANPIAPSEVATPTSEVATLRSEVTTPPREVTTPPSEVKPPTSEVTTPPKEVTTPPWEVGKPEGGWSDPRQWAEPLPFCSNANAGGCELQWGGPAIQAIETGADHVCVIPTDGSLSCWGSNSEGQIAYSASQRRVNGGTSAVVRVEVGGYVRKVTGGGAHTCVVIADNGRVRCWGLNDNGQLGLGHKNDLGDEPGELPSANVPVGAPAVEIAAGGHHTCALVEGGKVRCWGHGGNGELCSGSIASRGDHEDEMPPADISGISTATQIVAGAEHTCVLLGDGTVRCWGQSNCGQVGLLTRNRFGDVAEELVPPEVDVGGKVLQLAAGGNFTCALMEGGAVRCWGCNYQGQLGYGHTEGIGNQPGEMPPPDVEFGGRATQVVAGAAHVCVLLDTKKVRCWGDGHSGQLGVGERDSLGDAPGEMPPRDVELGDVKLLAAHMSYFTCALLVDGTVRCWGGIG
jgi:alpha-tubulin suppressor-like RCC1 family protein